MVLLEFARGPFLYFSLLVFVSGVAWRLWHLWHLPPMRDLSPTRTIALPPSMSAWRSIRRRMWPRPEYAEDSRWLTINGYVFHIGLAVVFLSYVPHIAFVKRVIGVSWSGLPDAVMYLASGVTIVSLLLALAMRIHNPVRRKISGADDWITWTLTFLPFITGMAAAGDSSANIMARDHVIYPGPLALHLISFELLLIWFPFGKLMHAFLFIFSRAATGVRMGHRGVEL